MLILLGSSITSIDDSGAAAANDEVRGILSNTASGRS
jgi:hypothetical protein